jgi:hypothetical protein
VKYKGKMGAGRKSKVDGRRVGKGEITRDFKGIRDVLSQWVTTSAGRKHVLETKLFVYLMLFRGRSYTVVKVRFRDTCTANDLIHLTTSSDRVRGRTLRMPETRVAIYYWL